MLKKICRYLVFAAAIAVGTACSGNETEDGIVPDGVLRIFIDEESTIVSDGTDKVVFRVMFGSQDVSTSPDMNLIRIFEGDERRLAAGVNEFSTTTPGSYTFEARYYDGEAYYTDNSVEVTAIPTGGEETSDWQQKVLAMEFTSTTCIGCPDLVTAMEAIRSERPDLLYTVAFHMDYQGPDPMKITESTQFASEFLGTNIALPALFFNMHKPYGQPMTNVKAVIDAELDRELQSYEPSCGISVSSEYDEASERASITVGVKSNIRQRCRVVVFLVENGIVAAQLDDPDYVHNHVVRNVLSSGIYGDYVNDRMSLYPGQEYTSSYSATISQDWNPDNMEVVATVLVPTADGKSYLSDNTNSCRLADGSADYRIND